MFLNVAEFSYNTVWDRWKNASMPRNVSINYLLITIQYRVVTDGQTATTDTGYGASIALRGKNDSSLVSVSKFAVIFKLPQNKNQTNMLCYVILFTINVKNIDHRTFIKRTCSIFR